MTEDSAIVDGLDFLRRNLRIMLVMAGIGLALGWIYTSSQAPDYRATASIEIQDLNENFLNLKEVTPIAPGGADSNSNGDVQTQLRILTSHALLERTLGRISPEQIPPPKGIKSAIQKLIASITGAKREAPNAEDVLDRTAQSLQVQPGRQGRIVDLVYESPDPVFAARFVNTLAAQYMDQSIESRTQLSQNTMTFLSRQMQELREKLSQSQTRLQDYAQRTGLVMSAQDRAPAAEKLRQVQTSLSNAQENRMVRQARLETISSAPSDSIDTAAGGAKKDYKTKLSELHRERADLLAVYQPDFSGVVRLDAQIAALDATLKSESLAILQEARNDYNDAVRRETLLRDSYVNQTQLVTQEAESAIQYGMLKNEVDSNQHLYEMILQQTAEAKVAAAMRSSNTRLIDAAKTPRQPYRPSRALNLLWGGTSGLLLSLVIATARERYDRRIKQPGEMAYHLDIPELGTLPSASSTSLVRSTRDIADEVGLSGVRLTKDERLSLAMAESCRGILTSILFSDEVAQVPQVIVVTSAEHGEGKTTLATNLAASLAKMNRRVLLIDGNLRHPELHTIFNLPNDYGLSDLLTLQTDNTDLISYVAQPTPLRGVHVLAAGPHDARALDMLYSAGTLNLLSHARNEFDTILIDTPPMLNLPDARVLGRMADGVVLVARADVSTRDTVLAAKHRLEEDRTALLGTVLNHWAK
ncbi:MAG: polysaccharide biosynthesis tyrosine autokinase [Acidobacteriota bacterium]